MKVYRIRDTKTGLYSVGGSWPRFSKRGKVWTSRGALKSHLNQCSMRRYDYEKREYVRTPIPETWEIIEYDLEVAVSIVINAQEEASRPSKR